MTEKKAARKPSLKTRLAAAHKSMRDAIREHVGKNGAADGLVRIYPVGERNDDGEAVNPPTIIFGVPMIVQDVTPARAEDLLAVRPPAFTLYESGNVLAEHREIDEIETERAWGVADPDDADDEQEPPNEPEQPEGVSQQ